MKRSTLHLCCMALGILLLAGCIQPISDDLLTQLTDDLSPGLELTSPEDGSAYLESVTVEGRITDEDSPADQITSLSFTVANSVQELVPATEVIFNDDGTFSFSFDAVAFSGDIRVTVTVTDWNQNAVSVDLILEEPESELPSFTAIGHNESVVVTWRDVSGAQGYELRYTTDGAYPTSTYGYSLNFASGLQDEYSTTIANLSNGEAHVFQLIADMGGGEVLASGYETALPLSNITLLPAVEDAYRAIVVDWPDIPGAPSYEIWRSVGSSDSYTNYKQVTGPPYEDTDVQEGIDYFYRIRPVFEGADLSGSNWGTPNVFPEELDSVDQLSSYNLSDDMVLVEATDDILVGGLEDDTVVLLDVSSPDNVQQVASFSLPGLDDFRIWDDHLFVVTTAGVLHAYDISTLSSPVLSDSFTIPGSITPRTMEMNEWYAFVLDTTGVVHIVNTANPASLSLRETFTPLTPGSVAGYAATLGIPETPSNTNWTYYYVGVGPDASNDSHLMRCYVYAPSSGNAPGQFSTSGYTRNMYAFDSVTVAGDGLSVYVAASSMAIIELPYFDVSIRNASNQTEVGTTASIDGTPGTIEVNGDYLFTKNSWGYTAIDISTPASPAEDDNFSWDTPGPSLDLAVNGRQVFVASDQMELQMVTQSGFGSLSVADTISGLEAYAVTLQGDTLFVAEGASDSFALRSYDISDPSNASALDIVALSDRGSNPHLSLAGDYLLVTSKSTTMDVVDITDPNNLVLVDTLTLDYSTGKTELWGQTLYTLNTDGLTIYNASDLTALQFSGFNDKQFSMNDMERQGDLLYIADSAYFRPSDLFVYDVSNPSLPINTDKLTSFGSMMFTTDIRGNYLFGADNFPSGGAQLRVLQIDPSSPSTYLTPPTTGPDTAELIDAPAVDLEVQGVYAFVLVESQGLMVIDASDFSAMDGTATTVASTVSWASMSLKDLEVRGGIAVVADANNGVKIIPLVD